MNRNRPTVSVSGVLIMGGTVGAQVLTVVSLLFPVAYYEPGLLTWLAVMKANPTMITIISIWIVVLSLWALMKITFAVGESANRFLTQVFKGRVKNE